MSYLLIYSGKYGQTKKIIFKISEYLKQVNKPCDVQDLNIMKKCNFSRYLKVLIGASIHYGRFNPAFVNFVDKYQKELNIMPTAFCGVNLTARKQGKDRTETNIYMVKFLSKISWKPTITTVFAGALCYSDYTWFDRIMIQFIMRLSNGKANFKKNIEYTDWKKVEDFANQFSRL
ncbi:menaquinone-dependent protoporphyrinogen IX dehydrogenase [Arsenophonus symbiont of Ornithomya chloropus]|uniref:menaquinone-dependent protoporphyrinogen IX dehydrogenase n=1 Tax=Arsenophonus symbiont of Ornithomya chloropus TaxID=634121 RepID=UPI0032B1A5BD